MLSRSRGPEPRALPNPRHTSVRGLPAIPKQKPVDGRDTDFWIPQVTQEGQIYYTNTRTGQHSRDLPKEPDEDTTDSVVMGLTTSQSSMRSGTGAELGFVPKSVTAVAPSVNSPPEVVPVESRASSSTSPSPDSQGASVSAIPARPSTSHPVLQPSTAEATASQNGLPNRVPGVLFDAWSAQSRRRSYSSSHLLTHPERSRSGDRVYPPSRLGRDNSHMFTPPRKGSQLKKATIRDESRSPGPTLALHPSQTVPAAHNLDCSNSPESLPELLEHARHHINSIIAHLQQYGIPQLHGDQDIIDNLIEAAVTSIRNLLYVAGSPSRRRLGVRNDIQGGPSRAAQTHLVSAQRRAIATLSKFMLSVRAALNVGPQNEGDFISPLGLDAKELERAVVDFVSMAQSIFHQLHGDKGQKHLRGYLDMPRANLGKEGAGAAGSWKGFGWVSIDDSEEAPRRSLDRVTFNEFEVHASRVQEKLKNFSDVLQASRPGMSSLQSSLPFTVPRMQNFVTAEMVFEIGKGVVHELSSLLTFLGDIHIARHVDIELADQDKLADGAEYSRTVSRARTLVRGFEAACQALYDDSAALLTKTQCVRRTELCDSWRGRDESYDALEALSTSAGLILQLMWQHLESLLVVGQEQECILERCHGSPMEWRMSQRSFVAAILADETMSGVPDDRCQLPYHVTGAPENIVGGDVDGSVRGEQSPSPPPVPSGKPMLISRRGPDASSDNKNLGFMRTTPRPDKIEAFFGDEAPAQYLIPPTAETKPWYLRPNHDPAEVLIDPDGTVRGGTVAALVERLTAHEYADPKFNRAFLMTFRSFTTLDELLKLLIDRFWIQPPPNLDTEDLGHWRKFKQYVVRMRVINTLKSMIQDGDVLEKEELGVLDHMAEFASQVDVFDIPAAKQLLNSVKRARRGMDHRKITVNTSMDPPPAPIVPKRIELLEIEALELARQLTITESQLYQKIRPSECMQRSQQSKQRRTDPRDGVANFIRRSNKIAHWVAFSILSKDEARRRASVIKHFILVADQCRMLQNFSTMGAIVSGLNSAPIHRLKRSWEQVSSRHMSQLQTCEATINSYRNYNKVRTTLATVSPPCVPFVGVFLTALTHIQDGSKDYLPGNLVNFRKRQKVSEVIQDLQRWQTQPHNFHPLPSVLVYIDESLQPFGEQDVSDLFWDLSLEREPREREEEKLVRILHESGFF
ncbi:ras GEF [Pisolithus albus]|nr:ras GEF [Pisolithus albus]